MVTMSGLWRRADSFMGVPAAVVRVTGSRYSDSPGRSDDPALVRSATSMGASASALNAGAAEKYIAAAESMATAKNIAAAERTAAVKNIADAERTAAAKFASTAKILGRAGTGTAGRVVMSRLPPRSETQDSLRSTSR